MEGGPPTEILQDAEELEPTDSISKHFIHPPQGRIYIAIKAPSMWDSVLF